MTPLLSDTLNLYGEILAASMGYFQKTRAEYPPIQSLIKFLEGLPA
jgi:hypothetical protein